MSANSIRPQDGTHQDEDEDVDAIFAELEAESAAADQEQLRQLKAVAEAQVRSHAINNRAAIDARELYLLLRTDDETLRFTTEHEKAIVHFRHRDFARCSIMDDHLDKIARRHGSSEASGEDIAFAKVDVSDVPFVVEKLGVRVLPCVIGFAQGIVKGRITGFEGICWDGKEQDSRVTKALEDVVFSWGLIRQRLLLDDHDTDSDNDDANEMQEKSEKHRRGIRGPAASIAAEEDDDEWD